MISRVTSEINKQGILIPFSIYED